MSKSKTNDNEAVTTSVVRDIALNKLLPSPENVRKTYNGESVAELAASIAAHGLLQNLVVKADCDADNRATGKYQVDAGGRRLAALKLLAKQKKLAKNAPVSCRVRDDDNAEEVSLAENVQREALHPADEFEAFRDLHEKKGLSAEEIGARFGKPARFVKERLKLGTVSPTLMALYRKDEMTLEQLMAFTVTGDHARQEEVWTLLGWNNSASMIRHTLLKSHVPAGNKRALFVGLDAYQAAGGTIVRDLFTEDGGGYLADPALLDRLALAKLQETANIVRQEGWKWVEFALDYPHDHGMARIQPHDVPLSEGGARERAELEGELDALYAQLESYDGIGEEIEAEIDPLVIKRDAIDAKAHVFDPADIARAGAIVTVGHDGEAEIARGYVQPGDIASETDDKAESEAASSHEAADETPKNNTPSQTLSDRLIADLTAQRTMALRDALADKPDIALTALIHSLVLQRFQFGSVHSCLDITARSTALHSFADGIDGGDAAMNIANRHDRWAARFPEDAAQLWDFVVALSLEERSALLAHCVALSMDAVQRPGYRDGAHRRADLLARAIGLDMTTYWQPTVESYLGRVSKDMIAQAVSEAGFADAARRIGTYKKSAMASAAEEMLANKGWLPELLRTAPPERSEQAGEEALPQAAE